MKRCSHKRLRYISHTRGSQDGVACEKCRAFRARERQRYGGSALVRRPRTEGRKSA